MTPVSSRSIELVCVDYVAAAIIDISLHKDQLYIASKKHAVFQNIKQKLARLLFLHKRKKDANNNNNNGNTHNHEEKSKEIDGEGSTLSAKTFHLVNPENRQIFREFTNAMQQYGFPLQYANSFQGMKHNKALIYLSLFQICFVEWLQYVQLNIKPDNPFYLLLPRFENTNDVTAPQSMYTAQHY